MIQAPKAEQEEQPAVSPAIRRTMQANKGRNTKPELAVRSLVHEMGYRYRLHCRGLPGRPDLVFASRKAVIEVRGCFWHRHSGCRLAYVPKTRKDFWQAKFDRNVERDLSNTRALENAGWRVLTVWECELSDAKLLAVGLRAFLDSETHVAAQD